LDEAGDFGQAALEQARVHPDSLVILAPQSAEENLALGRPVVDVYGKQVPLSDGSAEAGRSEWLSGTPNVVGQTFTADLGVDRAITRVRLLPGGTAQQQPEYFIRGYRLEAATQRQPEVWRRLAEQQVNFKLIVDTLRDSTWEVRDGAGGFRPRLGRYVRLTLIRQDRSNWVALGEIEVFGAGYASEGQLMGEFIPEGPVNAGQVRWQAQLPPQTQALVQVRGSASGQGMPGWEEGDAAPGGLFSLPEPIERLQYRVLLRTADPFVTPALQRLEVDFDPVLVAREILGSVAPDTARKGVEQDLTYRVALRIEPGDYGVEVLRLGAVLSVEGVRFDGAELYYDWSSNPEEGNTLVAFRERLGVSGMLEIAGKGLFLQDRTPIPAAVGSREQEQRDGYMNWQNAREAPDATWTVKGLGVPPRLLSPIEVRPRPFSPFRDGAADFRFVVGNLQQETRIVLEVFTLAGERVRRLSQTGGARAYRLSWDGRDQDGRIAAPGLYLYEVRVETGDDAVSRAGTLVVAY